MPGKKKSNMNKKDKKDKREQIAMGICVSPSTVDRCPYCIDTCDAFHWQFELKKTLKDLGIISII